MSRTYVKGPDRLEPLRLVFYDDGSVYGGHEVMILNAIRYLVQIDAYQVVFIYSPRNTRLETELKRIQVQCPRLSVFQFPYTSGRLQFLRTLWAVRHLQRLRKLMKDLRPNCLIVGQGEIGSCTLGVLAGVREGIRTISYIPLAHSRQQRGERFARAKDTILRWYYRLPHGFITISDSMASMLRERGAKQPIEVVENGVDLPALHTIDKAQARTQLGLPRGEFVVALCGRIEFQQKGHDVLLHALEGRGKEFSGWTFLVVGDGPDKQRLEAMIKGLGIGDKVKLMAWQSSMSLVYSAIDMVVMPSRFEGVPVVLLEAMHYGLPIVASAVDAMAALLPRQWLFPSGNSDALADVMLRVRSLDNNRVLESNRRLVATRFTIERQRQEFARILIQSVDADSKNECDEFGAEVHPV